MPRRPTGRPRGRELAAWSPNARGGVKVLVIDRNSVAITDHAWLRERIDAGLAVVGLNITNARIRKAFHPVAWQSFGPLRPASEHLPRYSFVALTGGAGGCAWSGRGGGYSAKEPGNTLEHAIRGLMSCQLQVPA